MYNVDSSGGLVARVHSMLDTSALYAPPLVVLIIQRSQTFPVWSVMHGCYEDITKVDLTFTEPSHMIGGQGRVENCDLRRCASHPEASEGSLLDFKISHSSEQFYFIRVSESHKLRVE